MNMISLRMISGYGAGEACCRDCGVDLEPDSGQSDGSTEYAYMVRDQVWKLAGMRPAGTPNLLCVGCLENRLGRELVGQDFAPGYPGNWPLAQDTPRLAARKALVVRPPEADFWAEMEAATQAAAEVPALSGLRLPPMTRRRKPKRRR